MFWLLNIDESGPPTPNNTVINACEIAMKKTVNTITTVEALQ